MKVEQVGYNSCESCAAIHPKRSHNTTHYCYCYSNLHLRTDSHRRLKYTSKEFNSFYQQMAGKTIEGDWEFISDKVYSPIQMMPLKNINARVMIQ